MSKAKREEIAVVGMGCRLPGGVYDLKSFWSFLMQRGDGIVQVPDDRWSVKRFYDANPAAPGKAGMQKGGFLTSDFRAFDPLFFGISPREAAYMDPQQRLLLEVAYEAMEEGGIVPAELAGKRAGVFVGGFALDHMILQSSPLNRANIDDHHTATAASMTMLAARLSYAFDLRGPSLSIDTACSSSLVALHYACQGLLNGECDYALAGGVNLMFSPQYPMVMSKGQFLSADGHCKSFDARADGYARGEGAGIVVLKRLADAIADGDQIHAVLAATGVNQDGHTNGITIPNDEAQEALVREVADRGGVDLSKVQYVEAHGTGTPVGDPLEAAALARTIGKAQTAGSRVLLGSVKANLGHLEAAAGITGFMKACLVVEKAEVPPQANLGEENPNIPFADWGLELPREPRRLTRGKTPVFAAVNSFGYGGTNAHALLHSHDTTVPADQPVNGPQYLRLTARSDAALKDLARLYAARIGAANAADLGAIAYSAGARRSNFDHRAVVFGETPDALIAALAAVEAGEDHGALVTSRSARVKAKTAFVFSGMGPQWWAMGQTLLAENAVFRAIAEEADAIFEQLSGWSILAEMRKDEATSRMHETQVAQPANFIIQIGLAAVLKSRGIEPAAIVGHSVGEVSAAYVSGALDLADAVRVSYERSRLQQTTAGTGTMLAVGLSMDDCAALLKGREALVSIGAVNSPRALTLAGDQTELEKIAALLEEQAVFHRFLKVEVPYHSPKMDVLEGPLGAALAGLSPKAPTTPLYSTVTGARVGEDERHDAAYWFQNVRAPVLFRQAIEAMIGDGYQLFAEVGPNPVLSASIRDCAEALEAAVDTVYTLRRTEKEAVSSRRMIANLIAAGAELDWTVLSGSRRFVSLPTYPFQRDIHWLETREGAVDRLGTQVHPLIGARIDGPEPRFDADVSVNFMPWLADHAIEDDVVFPGAAYVEAALAAHAAIEGEEPAVLEALELRQAMLVDPAKRFPLRWSFEAKSRELLAATSANGEDWQTHAAIRVLAAKPWPTGKVDLGALEASHDERLDVPALYAGLSARGLNYGPAFRSIEALSRTSGSVFVTLALQGDVATEASAYRVHPTLLDGAFQALIAACGADSDDGQLFMPISIRRIVYYKPAGAKVHALGSIVRGDASMIEGNIRLIDADGDVVMDVRGLTCVAVGAAKGKRIPLDRWLFAYRWQEGEAATVFARDVRWLVLSDDDRLADPLRSYLDRQGAREVIFGSSDQPISDVLAGADLADLAGIIDLRPATSEDADPLGSVHAERLMALVQALPATDPAPRLYVVTRGQFTVAEGDDLPNLSQAAVSGFLRVVALERPELRATLIDIDADAAAPSIRRLGAEILADSAEDEIAIRGSARYLHRLERRADILEPKEALKSFAEFEAEPQFRLDRGAGGNFDRLRLIENERKGPAKGEVELKILSAALNFKDVLKVLGILPKRAYENTFFGETLGMEAAAVVTAVGDGVTRFVPGQRLVAAVPDCLASHVVLPENRLFALEQPDGQSGAEGATIPVAFMTAYYALHELARLKKGESVLIHAATGGVGLAAIQIAQWLGATIHATAGSPAKRDYLKSLGVPHIYDSRSLEFAEGIHAVTGGRGVDVILNSLSGEAFQESLQLLAPFGRFVEIGKRDIMENSRIPMAGFNENLSFNSVDLDRMMVERPQMIEDMLTAISGLMRDGTVTPLPVNRFKVADIADALRHMAQAKHMGKIVVDFEDCDGLEIIPLKADRSRIKGNVSYLVTGAFGGLGLELCRSLVKRGARHLVMAGRSGAASDEAKAAVAEFRANGIAVREARLDIADSAAVSALFDDVNASDAPLKGIFHAAAVLDDAMIGNLDPSRLAKVMTPKAKGAWVLHQASEGLDLDIFMLFSSATSLIGNPGQASYVAANVFLDQLVSYRRGKGLAATAINWGAIGGAGMLAGDDHATRQLERAGVRQIEAATAIAALETVLSADPGVMAVMDVDFAAWSQVFPNARQIARFEGLMVADESDDESARIARELAALPADERLAAVIAGISEVVAEAMKMPVDKIAIDRSLSELGIDSLIGVELQSALSQRFGVQISLLQLSKGASVSDLAGVVLKRLNLDNGLAAERLAA